MFIRYDGIGIPAIINRFMTYIILSPTTRGYDYIVDCNFMGFVSKSYMLRNTEFIVYPQSIWQSIMIDYIGMSRLFFKHLVIIITYYLYSV